jgi:hypothetical protein
VIQKADFLHAKSGIGLIADVDVVRRLRAVLDFNANAEHCGIGLALNGKTFEQ